MALKLTTLKAGVLDATALALLYGGTNTGKGALVKNIILTNTGSTVKTANIVLRSPGSGAGATDYQISPKDISIAPGAQVVLDTEITIDLSTTTPVPNAIYGRASTGATIDCIINGMERDV